MRLGVLVLGVVAALLSPGVAGQHALAADECVPVSTSWAEPPVAHPAGVAMRCVSFIGEPGRRVWPAVETGDGSAGTGEVVDATGAAACLPVDDEVCALTGTPPYRFLTSGPDPHRVAVRDVSGMTGCPAVGPAAFGTEPDDDHLAIGCRRLVAPRAGRYVVRTDLGSHHSVRSVTGEALDCEGPVGAPSVCPLDGDDHLLVADPLTAIFRTAVHRTDGRGCATTVGAGIARQVAGRATAASVDCVTLDRPRGSVVDALGAVGSRGPVVTVLDARGQPRCVLRPDTPDTCELTGRVPYRALLTHDSRVRYRLVLPRLDEPVGCERLPRRAGVDGQRTLVLRVPRGRVAACVTAPSRFLLGTSLYGVRRVAGDSPARLTVRDTRDGQCVDDAGRQLVFECRRYRPIGETTSIVLTTDGSGGRWRLAHRFITRSDG